MRAPFWVEFRWLVASFLFDWFIMLTERERSVEMAHAIIELNRCFDPDPKFNTVPLRHKRA